MKAETPSGKTASQPPTPSAPSIAEGETDEESSTAAESATEDNTSDNDGSQSSSTEVASPGESSRATSKASGKGKGKAKADSPEEVKKSAGDTGNLLGRINVLVTSDLGTIVDGTDFLTFGIYYIISMQEWFLTFFFSDLRSSADMLIPNFPRKSA